MHVCRRFLLSRLLFIVILCIRIDILDFFECNSAFCRCFHESVCRSSVFPSSCVSLACFLAVCCLFFVFLGCFLCFDIFHWLLRRWMVVYGSSRCVSCMLLSFCVGLLVCDFYGDFLCFYCISLHFIVLCIVCNVFDVAMVRESCLLLFTLSCPWQPISKALNIYLLPQWFWLCWVDSCYVLSIFTGLLAFSCCIMY